MRDIFDGWMSGVDTEDTDDTADTEDTEDIEDIKAEDMKTFIIKDDGTIYNQKSDYVCGDTNL